MNHKIYSMLLACTIVLVLACSNPPSPNNIGCQRYLEEIQAYRICETTSNCKLTSYDVYDRIKKERYYNEWCVAK